jgi:hypothetical protein
MSSAASPREPLPRRRTPTGGRNDSQIRMASPSTRHQRVVRAARSQDVPANARVQDGFPCNRPKSVKARNCELFARGSCEHMFSSSVGPRKPAGQWPRHNFAFASVDRSRVGATGAVGAPPSLQDEGGLQRDTGAREVWTARIRVAGRLMKPSAATNGAAMALCAVSKAR